MQIQRTGDRDMPTHLKILVSGSPKSGKTTFIGTVPNVLVADTEASANNLQSIAHLNVPYVQIGSSDDLRDLLMTLQSDQLRQKVCDDLGLPSIDAVAIDTLDSFQEILKAERLRETRQVAFRRDDWSWLLEKMTSIVQAFASLPMHVIFAVHTKVQNLGSDEDPRSIVIPALNGQMADRIAGMVGYSLATFRTEQIAKDGRPITTYWLRCEGDEIHPSLGNRSAGRLPAVVEPSFQVLLDSLPRVSTDGENSGGPTPVPQVEITHAEVEQSVVEEPPVEATEEPVQEEAAGALTSAALSHMANVWKSLDLKFDSAMVQESMTLEQAREVAMMWEALSKDHADGKCENPKEEMTSYLVGAGWAVAPRKASAPKARKSKAQAEPEKTDPIELVADSLGAEVIDIRETKPTEVCADCGNPVDDPDIAALAVQRFSKSLCVDDYRAASRAVTQ